MKSDTDMATDVLEGRDEQEGQTWINNHPQHRNAHRDCAVVAEGAAMGGTLDEPLLSPHLSLLTCKMGPVMRPPQAEGGGGEGVGVKCGLPFKVLSRSPALVIIMIILSFFTRRFLAGNESSLICCVPWASCPPCCPQLPHLNAEGRGLPAQRRGQAPSQWQGPGPLPQPRAPRGG